MPLRLDVNDPDSVTAAATAATDVTLLVNNAGNSNRATLLGGSMDDIRALMETHYFGTLSVTRAFAPVLIAKAPGAILNVASVLSWLHRASAGAYCAAKAALWAQTDSARHETRIPPGCRDHPARRLHGHRHGGRHRRPEEYPGQVAAAAVDGLAVGVSEVLGDDLTRQVRASLGQAPSQMASS